jgi:hypothetical protein
MSQLKALAMIFLMSSLLSCNSEIDVDLYAKDAASSVPNNIVLVSDNAPVALGGTPPIRGLEDTEFTINLIYTDEDNDKASSCSVVNLANITVSTACSCDGVGVCSVGFIGTQNFNGVASFDFTVTANDVISNTASINYSIDSASITCPTGFEPVDGNGILGTFDFCVMKYEAKCSMPPCDNTTDIPISQAAGTPWVSIRADESAGVGSGAQARCEAMSEGGFSGTFSLISNPEWMTIARDIENTASNWSSGIVGTGQIPRGHSDSSPSSALAITDVNDPYIGTGNNSGEAPGSGWEQKRTHALSNGSEIWDFAGNVYSWVDWDASSVGFDLGPVDETAALYEFPGAHVGSLTNEDYKPENLTYTSVHGMGRWYGGSGGATLRGGFWSEGLFAGAFSLILFRDTLGSLAFTGFRCSYRPQQAPIAKAITSANANENTESLVTLKYGDLNGDQATSCSVLSLTNVTETTSCSCSAGTCTVGVTGITNYSGPASFNYTVTDDDGTSNIAIASFSISANILCPTGFVEVNGNGILGTADFCVMKYEAKCDGAGACNDTDTTSLPISQATNTPWVSIRADESAGGGTPGSGAQARCEAMSEGGFTGSFSLISNPEWMTIARDAENQDANWSQGVVGSGCLFRGNTGTNDACGYNGANPVFGADGTRDAKSKLVLSNGSEIWDLAGNVYSWVDWDSSLPGFSLGPVDESLVLYEFPDAHVGSLTNEDYKPENLTYTSIQGMGQWIGGAGGAAARGGNWSLGAFCGVFSLRLSVDAANTASSRGFRCSYRP